MAQKLDSKLVLWGGLASAVGIGASVYLLYGKSRKKGARSLAHEKFSGSLSTSVQGMSIEFEDVSLKLQAGSRNHPVTRMILNQVSGQAPRGKITAFLGPSGAGKTSLLSLLAGQLPQSKKLEAFGTIRVNGQQRPRGVLNQDRVAFVHQDQVFFSHLTVSETIELAIQLRLGLAPEDSDRRASILVELLEVLNLSTVRDSFVGDLRTRGISGGEKKRLALACEMIGWPSVLFCDEPTSGLDAHQALQVMQTLRRLADRGVTILCTLHQPRFAVYQEIDSLLLLSANGHPIFSGQRDALPAYLESRGFPIPAHCNPADFALDLIALPDTSQPSFTSPHLTSFPYPPKKHPAGPHTAVSDDVATKQPQASAPQQFRILLRRSLRQLARDTRTLKMRVVATTGAAAVFAVIYWKLDLSQAAIFSRQGLLQVLVNYTAMTSLVKTIKVFSKERTLVQREISQVQYSVEPYLLSKICSDLPLASLFPLLLGCIVYPATGLQRERFPQFCSLLTLQSLTSASLGLACGAMFSLEPALEAGKTFMMISIIFGGFYFNQQTLPKSLRFLSELSLVRKGFEGMLANEFPGLKFIGEPFSTGEQVLKHINVSPDAVRDAVTRGGLILALNYALTYAALKLRQPRPIVLQGPADFTSDLLLHPKAAQ
eukprot:g43360.t1